MLLGPYRSDLYVEKSFVDMEQLRTNTSNINKPPRNILHCPILCVVAEKDVGVMDNAVLQGWQKETTKKMTVQKVPGTHMFIRDSDASRDLLSSTVSEMLSSLLLINDSQNNTERKESERLDIAHVIELQQDGSAVVTIHCRALPSAVTKVLCTSYEKALSHLLNQNNKTIK